MPEALLFILALAEAPPVDSHSFMSPELFIGALYVFALAAFLGYQVISRVPPLLHTPLMSATNAISAISVVGALVTAGGGYNRTSTLLGFLAVVAAMTNVVGGFMITDRMLRMFRKKPSEAETAEKETKRRG
ncbi:MAG: H+-translocating transhydrogenase subunit alpha [Blastocatellia bacterium]